MDPLEAVFLFCFVFGLALSGLSFVLGSIHLPGLGHGGDHAVGGHGHGDAHPGHLGDAGHAHAGPAGQGGNLHADADGRVERGGPSPFNVNTLTAFLAFFGGIGYVLYGTLGVSAAIALIAAVLAGLAGGAVVFFFLVKVLLASERVLDPADYRLEGSLGRVSRAIRQEGIGEIIFTKGGARRSEGARSANGAAIPAETEVVIVRYERGIAYVEPWKSYVGGGDRT